jgi:hypothetical protein
VHLVASVFIFSHMHRILSVFCLCAAHRVPIFGSKPPLRRHGFRSEPAGPPKMCCCISTHHRANTSALYGFLAFPLGIHLSGRPPPHRQGRMRAPHRRMWLKFWKTPRLPNRTISERIHFVLVIHFSAKCTSSLNWWPPSLCFLTCTVSSPYPASVPPLSCPYLDQIRRLAGIASDLSPSARPKCVAAIPPHRRANTSALHSFLTFP